MNESPRFSNLTMVVSVSPFFTTAFGVEATFILLRFLSSDFTSSIFRNRGESAKEGGQTRVGSSIRAEPAGIMQELRITINMYLGMVRPRAMTISCSGLALISRFPLTRIF